MNLYTNRISLPNEIKQENIKARELSLDNIDFNPKNYNDLFENDKEGENFTLEIDENSQKSILENNEKSDNLINQRKNGGKFINYDQNINYTPKNNNKGNLTKKYVSSAKENNSFIEETFPVNNFNKNPHKKTIVNFDPFSDLNSKIDKFSNKGNFDKNNDFKLVLENYMPISNEKPLNYLENKLLKIAFEKKDEFIGSPLIITVKLIKNKTIYIIISVYLKKTI